jgi:hypothetical protein
VRGPTTDIAGPAVSIVLATSEASPVLDDTLRSLARQSLPADRYEIVIARHGVLDAEASAAMARVQTEFPAVTVRQIECGDVTRGRAVNAALAASRGEYVTLVDDGDTVSSSYLEALLAGSAPDVLTVAYVAEIVSGKQPDFSIDGGAKLLARAGEVLSPGDAVLALSGATAKLVLTALARAIGFDADHDLGDDTVFCVRLVSEFPLRLRLCPVEAHAVYYRDLVHGYAARTAEPFDVNVEQRLDIIERLGALAAHSSLAGALFDELISRQFALINRYLHRHPRRHAGTVASIERRGLTSVPWAQLNKGVARDLAILYLALPHADTSALIAARRIRERRVVVDVVSINLRGGRGIDGSADAVWRRYLDQQERLSTPPTLSGDWPLIAAFCRDGMQRIENWERAKGAYRSVYSRTMTPAAHLLAAWYKIRNPQVRWIAEFSDPQLYNPMGETRRSTGQVDEGLFAELSAGFEARGFRAPEGDNIWEWVELLPYALADTVLFTNDQQRDFMLAHCDDRTLAERARAASAVEHHPVPPSDLYHAVESAYHLEPGLVHVGYFGVFYSTRGLTEVVEALKALSPEHRARMRLHVFTRSSGTLEEELREAGLDDVVRANPYVSFLEFLNLSTRMDALLVNDYRTSGIHKTNPYLPAKYADYVGSGRAIWGIVEPGSVLSTRALDYRSELGDVDGTRAVLEQMIERMGQPTAQPASTGSG